MIIIGAGMAGLLAGAMLRSRCSEIHEASPDLPNNLHGVFRHRTSVVGDLLNIPFREVNVLKTVHRWRGPAGDAMAYSKKTTGTYTVDRSIITADGSMSKRYISPPDFLSRLERSVEASIKYGSEVDGETIKMLGRSGPVVSTLPMPTLMKLLGWPKANWPTFQKRQTWSVRMTIDGCDAFCSVYVPSMLTSIYRVSVTGDQLIIEAMERPDSRSIEKAMRLLGVRKADIKEKSDPKLSIYGKILPIPEEMRKRFILWASEQHGVYSLGRFATWRPGLLLDDIPNDVRQICRLIDGGSAYDLQKKER